MKFLKQFLFLLVLIPFIVVAQKSKTKNTNPIAYIEQTKILKSLQNFEQNTKEVDSLKQTYAKEIQENTIALNEKINVLLKPLQLNDTETIETIKAKLKDNDLAKFDLYLQENELIEKASKNYDLMLKTIYEQKVQPLIDKVNVTIEEYAKSNDIKIVLTLENISPALAYIDKGVDITEIIIMKLK
jgi:Skp family chaperone for outer membrane proteins